MALAGSDALASFDQTAKKLDLSPVLAAILLNDTEFLGLIGMGQPVLAVEHRFNEDEMNSPSVTADSTAMTAAATTLTMAAAADTAKLRVGALLQDQAAGKSEIMQVTLISSNDLTVTRGYGSTDGETHAGSAVYDIVSMPVQEGDETITDRSKARTSVTLYTAMFKREVKISGSLEAEAQNGIHPGVPSELKLQILRRTDEMKVEMDQAALKSVISSSVGSDSVYRTIKGLREYLVASGGNNSATEEALNDAVANAMMRRAFDDGGNPDTFVGGPDQITKFAGFAKEKVRYAPSDKVVGVFVEKFLTELGRECQLLLDRWFRTDELALIEKAKVYWAPLKGRGLFVKPLAEIGDAQRLMVMAEGLLICKNATKAHAYHTKLTVSS